VNLLKAESSTVIVAIEVLAVQNIELADGRWPVQ
jgi:hypothetical protein